MNAALMLESVRLAFGEIVLLVDSAANSAAPIEDLYQQYKKAIQRRGKQDAGKRLGISGESLRDVINRPVEFAMQAAGQRDGPLAAIACLRCLLVLEPILQKRMSHDAPLLTEPQTTMEEARKQVRALELILRAMIQERHGDQDQLLARLRVLFANAPQDIAEWLRTADPGNILSGMLLADLTRVFTHKSEWHQFAGLYDRVQVLQMAHDQRETIEKYLVDVNMIRNRVYHHKHLTRAQIELLNVYYAELVEPIQRLFRSGRTIVNPQAIAGVDKETVDRFFGLQQEVSGIKQKTKLALRLAVAVLLLVVSAIAVRVLSEKHDQHVRALEYQSLGWVVASPDGGTPEAIQVRPFVGGGAAHFDQVALTAAIALADGSAQTFDLSRKLTIEQRGAQEAVSFAVPDNAKELTLCLVVPSAELDAKYRVTQAFHLTKDGGSLNPVPASAKIVTAEDGSSCTLQP